MWFIGNVVNTFVLLKKANHSWNSQMPSISILGENWQKWYLLLIIINLLPCHKLCNKTLCKCWIKIKYHHSYSETNLFNSNIPFSKHFGGNQQNNDIFVQICSSIILLKNAISDRKIAIMKLVAFSKKKSKAKKWSCNTSLKFKKSEIKN